MMESDSDYSDSDSSSVEFEAELNILKQRDSNLSLELTKMTQKIMNELKDVELQNTTVDTWKDVAVMNSTMQQALEHIRKGIQSSLTEVRSRFKENAEQMKKLSEMNRRGEYLCKRKIHSTGITFFRDSNNKICPHNEDYLRRVKQGEVFPMDFELTSLRHIWSAKDKVAVVLGIKEQAVDYISTKRRLGLYKKKIVEKTATLADLLKNIDNGFVIDWFQVSAHNVNHRHSPSACKAMWDMYLNPSLNREGWTEEETERLIEVAEANGKKNWAKIAMEMKNRSPYQCYVHYSNNLTHRASKVQQSSRWTNAEKQRLLDLVEKNTTNGTINWNIVASQFPNRASTAVQGYFSTLSRPEASHGGFTAEEDLILLSAVKTYGTKFSKFPRSLLPNRSLVQIRNHYENTLKNRHKHRAWTVEDDKKLLDFVSEHGTSSWLQCAEYLGTHNRISCRSRYFTMKGYFLQNPTCTIADLPRKQQLKIANTITVENLEEKIIEYKQNPGCKFKPSRAPRKKRKRPQTKSEVEGGNINVKKIKSEVSPNEVGSKEKPEIVNKPKPKKRSKPAKSKPAQEVMACNKDVMEGGKKIKKPVRVSKPEKPKPAPPVLKCNNFVMEDNLFALCPIPYKKRVAGRRQYPVYKDRLRNNGTATYNFFKFSYDHELPNDRLVSSNTQHLNAVARVLDFKRPGAFNFKSTSQLGLKKQLPPSYATLMATRALLLASEPMQRRIAIAPQQHNESNAALSLFQNRFRALFKETFTFLRQDKAEETPIKKIYQKLQITDNSKDVAEDVADSEDVQDSEDEAENVADSENVAVSEDVAEDVVQENVATNLKASLMKISNNLEDSLMEIIKVESSSSDSDSSMEFPCESIANLENKAVLGIPVNDINNEYSDLKNEVEMKMWNNDNLNKIRQLLLLKTNKPSASKEANTNLDTNQEVPKQETHTTEESIIKEEMSENLDERMIAQRQLQQLQKFMSSRKNKKLSQSPKFRKILPKIVTKNEKGIEKPLKRSNQTIL